MLNFKHESGGIDKVAVALRGQSPKGKNKLTISVVYLAPYAIYVHEDVKMPHPRGGECKYLEKAVNRTHDQVINEIAKKLKSKKSLEIALVDAAQIILRKSQTLVPVDTNELHESARVLKEEFNT